MNNNANKKRIIGFGAIIFVIIVTSFLLVNNFNEVDSLTQQKTEYKTFIVFSPDVVNMFYDVNAQDKLIAVGEYTVYPPQTADIPKVSIGVNTNIEQLISLNPDVIIMPKMWQTQEQFDQLANAGIHMELIDINTTNDIYEALETVGILTAKEVEASQKINEIQNGLIEIQNRKDIEKSVYIEVSPLEFGLYTAGAGTFLDEMVTMTGSTNIFSDINGWSAISLEQIIDKDPNVILTTAENYGIDPIEELKNRNGFSEVNAIKNNEIYAIDGDLMSSPGSRIVEATDIIYNTLSR